MKLVLATHHFPPNYVGGVELITLRLARWMRRHGIQVEIVCVESIAADKKSPVQCNRHQFEDLTVNRLTMNPGEGISSFRQSYLNPSIGQWFKNYLQEVRPDLVHIHSGLLLSSSTLPAVKEVGLPLVVSLHDYWFICHQSKLIRPDSSRCVRPRQPRKCAWCLMTEKRRYRWIDRFSFGLAGLSQGWLASRKYFSGHQWGRLLEMAKERHELLQKGLEMADLIVTQSPFLQECVVAAGVSPKKICLVPYGLDLNDWPPVTKKRPNDGVFRIGYIGQISPPKGVHLLIKAFRKLKSTKRNIHLAIYGNADQFVSYGQKLRKLSRDDFQITFEGSYENCRLPEILSELDVVVVPSQWFEIGPLVTLEAFATKTPVIATNLPNMNAQITHGRDGLLFEPGSFKDLLHQLRRLIKEPELLETLKSNIGTVRTFEDEARQVYEIYSEILGRSNTK